MKKLRDIYRFGIRVGNVKVLKWIAPDSAIVLSHYHKTILKYLEKELKDAIDEIKDYSSENKNISEECPIWVFWNQGVEKAPAIVKQCINSIVNNAGKHDVIILTDKNVKEYVEIPEIVDRWLEEGKIPLAFYADFIRVSLLKKYGGIWMDATLFMLHPFDEEVYFTPWYSLKNAKEVNLHFVSEYRWAVYFLCASEECVVIDCIHRLIMESISKIDGIVDYFLLDYLIAIAYRNNLSVKRIIDHVPDNNLLGHNFLADHLGEEYDEAIWNEQIRDRYLYKLSYKNFDEREYSDDSYYSRVVKNGKNSK